MKKVNFKRLSIVNFLSVGEEPVTIEFRKGLHVITGLNRDKPDRRNAIGKSTVADALYFAIFGETLRELKKDLITNNITGGKTHVELDFEVDSPKGCNTFKIIRTLSPTKVFVYKDGVDKTRDSAANTTKYICDVLSASPAVFQNCVIMTVNNAVPFMAKAKVEKRKFIEDIFGMEVFSQMLSLLRAEYNDIKRDHDAQFNKLEEVTTSVRNYTYQKDLILKKRKEKQELYLTRQQDNTLEKNKLLKQLDLSQDIDLSVYETKISELESKLDVCDDKISEYVGSVSTSKAEVTHTKDIYQKIGTGDEKCPVCLRSIEDHDQKFIESEKSKLRKSIEDTIALIKEVSDKLERAKEAKKKVQASIQLYNIKLSEAKLQIQNAKNISARIDQLDKWQEELQADLCAVETTETDFDTIIFDTEARLVELQQKVKEYRDNLAKLDIVKYVVSEEGVKSYIVNKLLELLNNKLLSYLRKLDSNSICIFNEYFEEEILNEKNKVCSYFNFSGAERKSIDLACLFTFSDIRRLQGGVRYNIAIYDELFDSSFDEKGIELITQILQDRVEELNECSIVISHRKESIKAVTGDVIFLEKENGITRRVDFTDI